MPRRWWLPLAKVALAVTTLVLLVSQIGFLLVPVLLPLHLWAARRSGPLERAGWSLLPAAGLATTAWAGVYVTVGEARPVIWLAPALVLCVGWALLFVWANKAATATVAG